MGFVRPDQSFYPSPRAAGEAPPETHGYITLPTALDDPRPDGLGVVDLDPGSSSYGTLVSRVDLPHSGDEVHHFGWNACSSALCPYAPHAHVERRYLIVPGLRSSRITILDTKADPLHPRVVKVIEPETVARRAGYSRPHTVHCGPDGIYVNARPQTWVPGFDLANDVHFYYAVLALLVAVFALLATILRSPFGRALQGIKANERRMRALGFATLRYKLAAFVVAGTLA